MTGNVIQNHTDLRVFQLAFDTSLEIHKQSLQFPKIKHYALADQIRRASKGICANIAEGFAKQQHSKNEFRRYLLMAIGSAHEMDVWIRYCTQLEYVASETGQEWKQSYELIARMLQNLYSKAK